MVLGTTETYFEGELLGVKWQALFRWDFGGTLFPPFVSVLVENDLIFQESSVNNFLDEKLLAFHFTFFKKEGVADEMPRIIIAELF